MKAAGGGVAGTPKGRWISGFGLTQERHLGSVDSLKADKVIIGIVRAFLQPVSFSRAATLESRFWRL